MPQVNRRAPEPIIEEWIQGTPSSLEQERGKVVLIEVFQVNCPGCFLSGLPEAIGIYEKFKQTPVVVWGLATAFEDFDKNSRANLEKLLTDGEVIGETLARLGQLNLLQLNRLSYRIPFPVAWDKLEPNFAGSGAEEVQKIIYRDFPTFGGVDPFHQRAIWSQVEEYLRQKTQVARTFELYGLQGTPSAILIDKKGNLRWKLFGSGLGLENYVEALLKEKE
ncbi:MAG: thiol-disulfide isomerase [Nitrospinae bacterium CG11_big_fil_rev_8_21_14_0_20_56_8]|nr:MAG: thiol-disulfide isomerase [Nitrospinae bacterium CG11_big_fil_rev_8_21_14_0_20_56_8]